MRQYNNKTKTDDVQLLVSFLNALITQCARREKDCDVHKWQRWVKMPFENKHLTILAGMAFTENLSRLYWRHNVV